MNKEPTGTKLVLIRAAGELFATHGFEGTSIRAIAEKAGTNIAAINYHFGTKENLYAEAILYVVLQDHLGRSAVVVHEDANVLTFARWQAWPIPYAAFEGVNPAAVTKLIIGMGDRAAPAPGGTGRVFLDDVYLTKPAPVEEANAVTE